MHSTYSPFLPHMTAVDPSDRSERHEATDMADIVKELPPSNNTALIQAATAVTDHTMTPMQAIRTYPCAFGWCMFMCMGCLSCGYDFQLGGSLLSVPLFRRDFGYFVAGQAVLPASWQSAFNCASFIGCMFGALSLGYLSDNLGRRRTAAITCLISIVGILIQFLSPAHDGGMLLAGKLINGFSIGMYIPCAGSYCVEVSPNALRGTTMAAMSLWIVFGQLMSNGVIRGTGNRLDAYAYKLPIAFQWIIPVIILIGLSFAPESPWWLIRKGRHEQAEKVLLQFGGPTVNAKLQIQQIQKTIELEDLATATLSYMDCFSGVNLRRTIIAMMVSVLQQAAGVAFVLGYSAYFFELAGFADDNAFDLGVGIIAVEVAGNLLAFYTINRFGRRFLFTWGMAICTAILLLVGFIWTSKTQDAMWAVSAFTIIYSFLYQVGIGPPGYLILAEVPSTKLRSKTVGIAICTSSLCAMVADIVIPYLMNPDEANLGGYVGLIFGVLSLAGTLWSYFFIPETKNRTVDELDVLFERRVSARHFEGYMIYDHDARKS